MGPEIALNRYVDGLCSWSMAVANLEASALFNDSAIAYLKELTPRMPVENQSERRDSVNELLLLWPLARHFGLHAGRVVRVQRKDGEGVRVWQN